MNEKQIDELVEQKFKLILESEDFERRLLDRLEMIQQREFKNHFNMDNTEIEELCAQCQELTENDFVGSELRKAEPGKFAELLKNKFTKSGAKQ